MSELFRRADTSVLTDAVGRLQRETEVLRSQVASLQKEVENTVALGGSNGFQKVLELAELGVTCIVQGISGLGLRVAPHKTEPCGFTRNAEVQFSPERLVGGTEVEVSRHIKYLGLTLDSRWSFEEHFERMIPQFVGWQSPYKGCCLI